MHNIIVQPLLTLNSPVESYHPQAKNRRSSISRALGRPSVEDTVSCESLRVTLAFSEGTLKFGTYEMSLRCWRRGWLVPKKRESSAERWNISAKRPFPPKFDANPCRAAFPGKRFFYCLAWRETFVMILGWPALSNGWHRRFRSSQRYFTISAGVHGWLNKGTNLGDGRTHGRTTCLAVTTPLAKSVNNNVIFLSIEDSDPYNKIACLSL